MIQEINPSEAPQFYELRLAALQINPEAFATDSEAWMQTPLEKVEARLAADIDSRNRYTFGAFDENHGLVGMIGVNRSERKKVMHKASFWGLWVEPKHRRKGIGHQLVRSAVECARQMNGVKQVRLTVTTETPAILLFEQFGFKLYGEEGQALVIRSKYYDRSYLNLYLEGL